MKRLLFASFILLNILVNAQQAEIISPYPASLTSIDKYIYVSGWTVYLPSKNEIPSTGRYTLKVYVDSHQDEDYYLKIVGEPSGYSASFDGSSTSSTQTIPNGATTYWNLIINNTTYSSAPSGGVVIELYQKNNLSSDDYIETKTIYLRTDADAPVSHPNLSYSGSNYYNIYWTDASDNHTGASGLKAYDVSYREGSDGNWILWKDSYTGTSSIFEMTPGNTYFFKCEAIDKVGNRESKTTYDFAYYHEPEISISSPGSGTVWETGQAYPINWSDNFAQNVQIVLCKGLNKDTRTTISASTASDGSYSYTVDESLEDASDYSVRIRGIDLDVEEFSDYFQIKTSSLSVSATSILLGSNSGSSGTFSINSNASWTVSDDAEWLTVTPASGSNNGIVIVEANSENPSTSSARTATVTVTISGVTSKAVTVTQAQSSFTPTLSVSPSNISIESQSGASGSFDISSNTTWSVDYTANWISASPLDGTNNAQVLVAAKEANPSTSESRSATVTITASGGSKKTVNVTQAASAFTPTLFVSTGSVSIGSLSNSSGTFSVTSNTTWIVSDNADWLTVNPASGSNNGTVTAQANSANTSTSSTRFATVTITADGVSPKTVTVTQESAGVASTLSVSSSTLTLGSEAGSTASFDVSSNSYWGIDESIDWLSVSPSSIGYYNSSVTVTAISSNSSASSTRSAPITITSSDGKITKQVLVTQSNLSATSNLAVSATDLSLLSTSGSSNSFTITSNTIWTVSADASWLTIEPGNGSDDGEVTVTALSENTSTSIRTANVTVSGIGVAEKNISVSQAASLNLSVSESNLSLESTSGSNSSFTISSNTSWTISDDASWLAEDPTNGTNNGTISVTAISDNTTTSERAAIVTISGIGVSAKTINVKQAGQAASTDITISATNLSLDNFSGSKGSFSIKSSIDWTVSCEETWLVLDPLSGSNDGEITVTASSSNTSTASRSADVTVSGTGSSSQTITITQSGQPSTPWIGFFEPKSYSVWEKGKRYRIFWYQNFTPGVAISLNGKTSITDYVTTNDGYGSYYWTVPTNISAGEYYLQFISIVGSSVVRYNTEKFLIKDPPYLNINNSNVTIACDSASNAQFSISSNTSWTISSIPSWLSVSDSVGTNKNTVTITALSSTASTLSRSATLTIAGDNVNSKMITVTQEGQPTLSIPNSKVEIECFEGDTTTFRINSNINWEISSSDEWLDISPLNGKNNDTITLTSLSNNTSTISRSATLTVAGDNVNSQLLTVTQKGQPSLTVSSSNLSVDSISGDAAIFMIISNTNWEVRSEAEWLNVSPNSGSNDGKIIVTTLSSNTATSSRNTTLIITGNGVASDTVTITQNGSTPTLSVSPSNLNIGNISNDKETFMIRSNTSWNVSVDAEWLIVTPANGYDDNIITVTASNVNSSTLSREATISINGNGVSSKTVTITQDGSSPSLLVSESIVTLGSSSGSTGSISINSNTAWTLIDDANWLTVSPTNGFSNGIITITASNNNKTSSNRNATVTIIGNDVSSKTVAVIQEDSTAKFPFSDSFESGDFRTKGWSIAGNAVISSLSTFDGSYSVKGTGTYTIKKDFSNLNYEIITAKYAMKASQTSSNSCNFNLSDQEGNYSAVVFFNDNGYIEAKNGPTGNLGTPIFDYNVDTWYDMKVVLNFNSKTYDLYINDSLMAEEYGFFEPDFGNPSSFAWGSDDSSGTNWIDNISIYNGYNPVSIPDLLNQIPISIYPNPTKHILHINTMTSRKFSVNIFGISGKHLIAREFNSETTINVEKLNSGIYFIEIVDMEKLSKSFYKILKE